VTGIFIDTETGGLTAGQAALLSLGAVAFEVDAQGAWGIDEFSCLIKPHKDTTVSRGALDVQGISWASLDSLARIDEAEALVRFGEWWDDYRNLPMFAHNAPFDRDHLGAAIRRSASRHDYLPSITGRHANWNCTIGWANLLIAKGKMTRPENGLSLDSLAAHLGVHGRTAKGHDSLEDARIGVRIVGKLESAEQEVGE
jgi:DNA polymerase III epsilon subunit-like protein